MLSRKLLPEFFNYRVGRITRPIKSEFGYHLFKIIDAKLANTELEYDDVKDQIKSLLVSEKQRDEYINFITNLKSKVEIETNYELLNELKSDSTHIKQKMITTTDSI